MTTQSQLDSSNNPTTPDNSPTNPKDGQSVRQNEYDDVSSIELHANAQALIKEYVEEFTISLLIFAKVIARRHGADMVLQIHIREALERLLDDRKSSWVKELLMFFGSAFFGAFVQGFLSELPKPDNDVVVASYVALGFVGMLMVFWGLRRGK